MLFVDQFLVKTAIARSEDKIESHTHTHTFFDFVDKIEENVNFTPT